MVLSDHEVILSQAHTCLIWFADVLPREWLLNGVHLWVSALYTHSPIQGICLFAPSFCAQVSRKK